MESKTFNDVISSPGSDSGECGANKSAALSPLCTTKPTTNLSDSGTKRKASTDWESPRKRMKGAREPTAGQQEGVVKGTKRKNNTGQDPPCKKLRGGQHEANTSSSSSSSSGSRIEPVSQATKTPSLAESDTNNSSNPARAIKRKARSEELDSDRGCTRPAKMRNVESNTTDSGVGSMEGISERSSKPAKVIRRREEPDTSCFIIVSAGSSANTVTRTTPTNSQWDGDNEEMVSISHEAAEDAEEDARDDFEEKYLQLYMLGQGGFGSVYAGIRKMDDQPVAIKRIQRLVKRRPMMVNGRMRMVPTEVFMMLKVAGGPDSETTSAPVALLEWYDREDEVIVVMERPMPAVDLLDFVLQNRGPLEEDLAKNIMKQLVAAANEMHSKGILHRDLKLENLLMETSDNGPRVRIIDFGCACIAGRKPYITFSGTAAYAPPEIYKTGMYKASPTTVWQLGAILYEIVNGFKRFNTMMFCFSGIKISDKLSKDCQDFLKQCLAQNPEKRATLNQLQLHPWIR